MRDRIWVRQGYGGNLGLHHRGRGFYSGSETWEKWIISHVASIEGMTLGVAGVMERWSMSSSHCCCWSLFLTLSNTVVASVIVVQIVIIEDRILGLVFVGSNVDGRVAQVVSVVHGEWLSGLTVSAIEANRKLIRELCIVLWLQLSLENFLSVVRFLEIC